MLKTLFGHWSRSAPEASPLYGAIVALARQPRFYAEWGVPDTAMGRFEMVALHTALLQRRLTVAGPEGAAAARSLGEAFVTDMDDCMREIGVGDLSVPKNVKRAAAALYDRYNDLNAVLRAGSEAQLAAVIEGRVSGSAKPAALAAPRLAAYVTVLDRALAVLPDGELVAGRATLPLLADTIAA